MWNLTYNFIYLFLKPPNLGKIVILKYTSLNLGFATQKISFNKLALKRNFFLFILCVCVCVCVCVCDATESVKLTSFIKYLLCKNFFVCVLSAVVGIQYNLEMTRGINFEIVYIEMWY